MGQFLFSIFKKIGSCKIHELVQTNQGIFINTTLLYNILRAIMEVLGIGRYSPPICIREIIMAVHCTIDVPSFPMIRETSRYFQGEPYINK